MSRRPGIAKTAAALIVAAAIALLVAGCAFVKPGSFALSQPGGIGAVRMHFVMCAPSEKGGCEANTESETIQYLAGIAVPPGSTPPQTFTATSTNGGPTITFTRNDEVASEMTAASAATQKLISESSPKEKEEAEKLKPVIGGPWPPSGLQGVGYLSTPVQEVKGQTPEWTVDADIGLPAVQGGQPFTGPFPAALAFGLRVVNEKQSATRPVHCVRIQKGMGESNESESVCSGSIGEGQLGTSDLGISAPAKPPKAFVGGSAVVAYSLKFGSTGTTVPTFALTATSAAKGAKTKLSPKSFTPGAVDATTHLSPTGTDKVTVTVPRKLKPGTYKVTLTATAAQGGSVSREATFKVVKAKIKFGTVRIDPATGTATLPVKVPGSGKLTISGKGIAATHKKSKKAKTLKLIVKPVGGALAKLRSAGSLKLKAKATFKPKSGIAVSKTKSIVLKLS